MDRANVLTLIFAMLSVVLVLVVVLVLAVDVADTASTNNKVIEERRQGRPGSELVVARYEESLTWVLDIANRFTTITVYNKGQSDVPSTITSLSHVTVLPLPNVGRVDHTYLYHYFHRYHDLSDVTVMLPGSCDMDYKWEQAEATIEHALRTRDSVFCSSKDKKWLFYNFEMPHYKCKNKENYQHNQETETLRCPQRPFGKWFEHNFRDIVKLDEVEGAVFRAIFAVSRASVRLRPRSFYHQLLQYVNTHSNPEAGHYMERAWTSVFHPVQPHHFYPNPLSEERKKQVLVWVDVLPHTTLDELKRFLKYHGELLGYRHLTLIDPQPTPLRRAVYDVYQLPPFKITVVKQTPLSTSCDIHMTTDQSLRYQQTTNDFQVS